MDVVGESLPLAVLDFVGIEHGESASASVAGAVGIAQAVEAAGYRRYWVSEHHNMTSLACSAPELLTAHVGARTSRIRVGAAGIMLPNHAPLKVAEMFRTLVAMYPERIDLALGRAPGTDPLTAHVLRRGMVTDPAAEFPGQVGELLAFWATVSRPVTPTRGWWPRLWWRRGRSCSSWDRAPTARVSPRSTG
jgi:luciferase family oxidoreductase group 1